MGGNSVVAGAEIDDSVVGGPIEVPLVAASVLADVGSVINGGSVVDTGVVGRSLVSGAEVGSVVAGVLVVSGGAAEVKVDFPVFGDKKLNPRMQVSVWSGNFHLPVSQSPQSCGNGRNVFSDHTCIGYQNNIGL